MLPWVCSEIDHRGRQNMVKTSGTYWPALVCHFFCSYHILTSSVIYDLLLNRRTATWNVKPGRIKVIRTGETVNGLATGQLEWVLGGCLHDPGATLAPARVHSGSLSRLYICLHDTTTKQNVMPAQVTPAWVHPAQVFLLWYIRGWSIFKRKYVARVRRGHCIIPAKIIFLRLTSPW